MKNKSIKYWQTALYLNIIFRIFGPLALFLSAPIGIFLAWVSDKPDGYLTFRLGWKFKKYHRLDKILDYWWYIIILIYSFRLVIFPTILVLFLFRSIGQIISLVSAKEKYLLLFPNCLEVFFALYLVFSYLLPNYLWLFTSYNKLIIISFCFLFALSQEYRINIKKIYVANFFWKLNLDWSKNK